MDRIRILRNTGATLSLFNVFILLQSLETLSHCVERHVKNALTVVSFLNNHPKVLKVNHLSLPKHPDHVLYRQYIPNGAANIFTYELKGGQEEAWKCINSLGIFLALAMWLMGRVWLFIHIQPHIPNSHPMNWLLNISHFLPFGLSRGTEHINDFFLADIS